MLAEASSAGLTPAFAAARARLGLIALLFALAAGWVHYRARLAGDTERGLVVFVGAQLLWLGVILVRNGMLDVGGAR